MLRPEMTCKGTTSPSQKEQWRIDILFLHLCDNSRVGPITLPILPIAYIDVPFDENVKIVLGTACPFGEFVARGIVAGEFVRLSEVIFEVSCVEALALD